MTEANQLYRARFRKVLEYVEAHPDGDLSVGRLSGVAAFSKYHFHRQFSGLYGIGVYRYVRLVRLRRASYRLAFRGDRIVDIALACGYESHEAFARAFKQSVGQTPSEFRAGPRWARWHDAFRHLREVRIRHMKPDTNAQRVGVVDFDETRVAALEHRGDPMALGDTIRRFVEWRKANRLPPKTSATFNIVYDDPGSTPPADFRFDVCAAIDRPVEANRFGVVEKTIPAGRCAVLRHVGSDDTLGEDVRYLYAVWLPQSGEEPRDSPLFMRRVSFFPDVPESEAITDIYLPIR